MALVKIIMCCGLLWQIDYSHIPTHGEGNGLVSNGVFFIWSCLTKMLSTLLWLFSYSFVSSSLRPHGLQHARLPCPSPTPGACSNSCPLSWWCHPTISSSVAPFSTSPQSFPASVFSNKLFLCIKWPSSGVSARASVRPMNIQGWFPTMGSKNLLQHHSLKASLPQHSAFFMVQLSHPYVTTGKTIALTTWTFVSKVISLLVNAVSRFVITVVKLWQMSSLAPSISSNFCIWSETLKSLCAFYMCTMRCFKMLFKPGNLLIALIWLYKHAKPVMCSAGLYLWVPLTCENFVQIDLKGMLKVIFTATSSDDVEVLWAPRHCKLVWRALGLVR